MHYILKLWTYRTAYAFSHMYLENVIKLLFLKRNTIYCISLHSIEVNLLEEYLRYLLFIISPRILIIYLCVCIHLYICIWHIYIISVHLWVRRKGDLCMDVLAENILMNLKFQKQVLLWGPQESLKQVA